MMQLRTAVAHSTSCFPGLAHWGDLRALGAVAAFAGGICLSRALLPEQFPLQEQLYRVFLPAAIVCMIAGILAGKNRARFPLFCAAGMALHALQIADGKMVDKSIAPASAAPVRIYGDIVTPPAPRRDAFIFLLKVRKIDGDHHPFLCGKTYLCTGADLPPSAGSLFIDGKISAGERRKNRYEFDEYEFLRANGIAGKIAVEKILMTEPPRTIGERTAQRFRAWLLTVFKLYKNPDHRALIRASFTGEKDYIVPEINRTFQRSGLYHLLALSGFNAAILLTAVYFILWAFPVRSGTRHCIALAVLWVYFAFIGPIPSLTRAVIMATAVIAAMMLQRKNYPLQTLGLAGIIWLVFSPAALFQPGFQLSYGATFGILTLPPLLMKCYPGCPHPVVDYCIRPLIASLAVSFAAFCATLPVLLHHFGTVSLYGLIANIVAIPLMTASMWSFFAALLSVPLFPWISQAAVAVSAIMLDGLLLTAGFAEKVPCSFLSLYAPYPELMVCFYLLLILAVTVTPSKRRMLLAWGIPLLLCSVPADYLLRRAVDKPSVVRFATDREAAVTAVRWPRGTTWLFCDGKESAIRRSVKRSVAAWIHHTPGTTIARVFIAVPGNGLIDSGATEGRRQYHDADGINLVNSLSTAYPITCSFFSAASRRALYVSCGGSRLISDHTDSTVYIFGNGNSSAPKVFTAPVEVALDKNRFQVRHGTPADPEREIR